ncbi:development-specific protein LVN1.2 [Strongylocentrotus purpuratus]|uniref:Uncharacterized protein n=1 Tax=Strongylocentrotus purpuratus TaxID=7668 RepID=A0A7M7RDW6_STRPU|nr:development-specific protein LVN1.2 [Strongylocentrotus purpuratus]|eukprot:XP_791939.2 PREDICTED: development-specific protein LVN1.2 [Strongylocentrotus purpuratus]
MAKFAVLVVLALVVAVNAQKPLCSPPQFMAGLGFTIGQVGPDKEPVGFTFNQYGAWDFANRRLGLNLDILYPNGTTYNFRVIQDYAQRTQWTIFDQFRFCAKQAAPTPEPTNCLPPNSTVAFTGFLGGEKDRVYYDLYAMKMTRQESGNLEGDATFSICKESNIPLSNNFIGTYFDSDTPYSQVSTGGFYNVEVGIPDPKRWFDLPSYCMEATTDLSKLPKHIPNWTRLPNPRFF